MESGLTGQDIYIVSPMWSASEARLGTQVSIRRASLNDLLHFLGSDVLQAARLPLGVDVVGCESYWR